jgi:hypothetical protein
VTTNPATTNPTATRPTVVRPTVPSTTVPNQVKPNPKPIVNRPFQSFNSNNPAPSVTNNYQINLRTVEPKPIVKPNPPPIISNPAPVTNNYTVKEEPKPTSSDSHAIGAPALVTVNEVPVNNYQINGEAVTTNPISSSAPVTNKPLSIDTVASKVSYFSHFFLTYLAIE